MKRREIFSRLALLSAGSFLPACQTLPELALASPFFIPLSHIAANLRPHFPFRMNYQGVGQLQLSHPSFAMVPEQNKVRIGLTTGMVVSPGVGQLSGIPGLGQIAGRGAGGRCQLACGLRYDRGSRGIYLKDPVLEELKIDHFSSISTEPFRQLVNLFGPDLLDRHPIHTLDASLASRFLTGMSVRPGGIQLKFGA